MILPLPPPQKSIREEVSPLNIPRKNTPEKDTPFSSPQKSISKKDPPSPFPQKNTSGKDFPSPCPQKSISKKDSPLPRPQKISSKRIILCTSFEKMFAKKRFRLPDLKKTDQKRIHRQRMTSILATNGLGDEAPIHAPTKEGIQAGVKQGVLGRREIRVGVENARRDVAGCAEDTAILSQIGDAKR